ncbi:hypothetical protein CHS0354_030102 [Potamilus streckersoni]|uniref:ETFB lysine methyltransferase n=1 Tax=Potamilus streckersoni TaxID=2493646 RepID=A0AAE0RMB8_9BIVA|nr:hypothetical protein CHS0354_030102 [Potamilus streckersoni]
MEKHSQSIYTEVRFLSPPEHAEILSFYLTELGADGVEERAGETPDSVALIAYYGQSPSESELTDIQKLADRFAGSRFLSVDTKENINWFKDRQNHFPPILVGKNIRIIPEWEAEIAGMINIKICPGMAFGTGNHETTVLALEIIDRYAADMQGKYFVEVGTGSGVLAIAAVKLGLFCRCACDIQPESADEFRQNFRLSGIPQIPAVIVGGPEQIDKPADILIANMTTDELISLKSEFLRLLNPGSHAIFSGIYLANEDRFTSYFQPHFDFISRHQKSEWSAVYAVRKK